MATTVSTSNQDRQWHIVSRWQEFDGETRANLLRIVGVGSFYAVQLITYVRTVEPTDSQAVFHRAATAVAVCWTMVALANLLCLQRRIFPPWLKFASSAADVLLLTGLACVGNAARSPLVFAYFLIIALSGLRFSLRLVWCSTVGSVLAYLFLLASRDPDWFSSSQPPIEVPFEEKLVVVLSLALTGIILGQIIRRVRSLASEYADRVHATEREVA